MTPNTVLPPLPQPEFRLKWKGAMAAYFVDKPNIGDTDCFTAAQLREYAIAALALRPGGEPSDEQIESLVNRFRLRTNDGMREFARAVLALLPVGGADKPTECGEYGHSEGVCGNAQCLPSRQPPSDAPKAIAYAVLSTHSGDVQEIDLFKKRESAERYCEGNGGIVVGLAAIAAQATKEQS